MIEVNCFADLRTTVPTKAGDIAALKRYYDKDSSFHGGGDFVGFLGTPTLADDSGTIAKGSGFYWKRIINDTDQVNLYHFGARGDGTTDDSDAFKRMLTWSQSYDSIAKDIGVRFPAGKFLIFPMDLSASEIPCFALYGDDSPYGVLPRTTIISDKSANTVFKVNARRSVIQGIAWNGQASADTTTNTGAITADMLSNVQPFFENITIEGEFVHVHCFRAQYNGGTVIKLLDTLDTRFNQIYTQNTYARVFDVNWSNSPNGVWDHATAIELSNANFQYGYGDATLMMPRLTQGVIRNVWIEHTRFPGDLSNGQWIVDALSVEDCDNALSMNNSRVLIRQLNLQAGSTVTNDSTADSWLSGYERGWRRDENFGTVMTGSMKAGWYSGFRLSNSSTADKWFRIGKFTFPKVNQQWTLEIISKLSTASPSGVAANPLQAVSSGVTYLNLQRCASAVAADMFHRGLSAVVDVKYKPSYSDIVEVWVKLKAGSGDTMFNVRSTGPTRFDAGSCSLFSPDLSEVSDETTIGTSTPNARLSFHNGIAGLGANEKGVVTLATSEAVAPSGTVPSGYITLNVNGTDRKFPYYT
ncbi:amylovoran biosynthesis protein AmsF [Erwinia psidii]|uniref:Amylovoran biosynthesis protein AmsF n=1 Tax=Erwinia psidii TaxID=69224 RepID=A0A3N6TQY1_9GAMM|nr:amylovoran biosynthesis protein AmsF [Erwinia psidii]MCX8955818.1 amylovoran biosynthesis protein AmsF [Erwinia psidii]MCX8961625.1 amylovoran biosynthesis protein AmsF [Erwinia psidii]RQM37652.1 amylovoran biosynthesis protein AmsF [Erwinia psidii]